MDRSTSRARFTGIRVGESVWSTWEPENGRFDLDWVRPMLDGAHERGLPVVIGEYGLLGFDRHTGTVEQGEKLKFFEYLGHYARTRKLTTMLWDNGQHLDRTTFRWCDPELYAQIGLYQGSTKPARGRDYAVEGDRLALTAAALTRLSGLRGLRHERGADGLPRRPARHDASTTTAPTRARTTGRPSRSTTGRSRPATRAVAPR
ncbi:beta-galactosidase [Saccharothrix texasensis]|uniref:beta-galactosidase n=1 Tax=Saccharothrix texasensis TaxID=103734 RepID=UPI001B86C773|nr:beta-galactosidase [Saccharothrix texasensis]